MPKKDKTWVEKTEEEEEWPDLSGQSHERGGRNRYEVTVTWNLFKKSSTRAIRI